MFRYSKVTTGDALYNKLVRTEKIVRYLERLLNRAANTWESMGEKSALTIFVRYIERFYRELSL